MRTARFVIQVLGWAVGIPLLILAIAALLRGRGYRRYPVVFIYLLVSFAATLVNIPIGTQSYFTHDVAIAAKVNWINSWILEVLIFATVLNLIDEAISISRWRRILRVVLATGVLLFAGFDFWIQYLPPPVKFGVWLTAWIGHLSLLATVLDLALWMILIASRKGDGRLLLICGALGMQFTAEVIGAQIVGMSVPRRSIALGTAGAVVAVAGNLICLYVWWQTFRSMRDVTPARPLAAQ